MFTQDELRIIQTFLQRVQLQGSEASTLAMLQQKINGLLITSLKAVPDDASASKDTSS